MIPSGLLFFSHQSLCCFEYFAPLRGQGSVLGRLSSKAICPLGAVGGRGDDIFARGDFEKSKYEIPKEPRKATTQSIMKIFFLLIYAVSFKACFSSSESSCSTPLPPFIFLAYQ